MWLRGVKPPQSLHIYVRIQGRSELTSPVSASLLRLVSYLIWEVSRCLVIAAMTPPMI